jgi:hypothetical protein
VGILDSRRVEYRRVLTGEISRNQTSSRIPKLARPHREKNNVATSIDLGSDRNSVD